MMNAQPTKQANETMQAEAQTKRQPAFYRVSEEEQQNWCDWWLDFDRSEESAAA